MKINQELYDNVVVVTTTKYDQLDSKINTHRYELAQNTIRNAKAIGCNVVVVDGSTSKDVSLNFKDLGATAYIDRTSTMGASRRQAMHHACELGKKVIVWTEPEKDTFIQKISKLIMPIIKGGADIVIPKRQSLNSYPVFQQHTEQVINLFWKRGTNYDLDMAFGPKLFSRDISNYFLSYKGRYGDKWESICVPIMDAIADGRKIISTDIGFTYPIKQREHEENNVLFYEKRIEQLNNLITAFKHHSQSLFLN